MGAEIGDSVAVAGQGVGELVGFDTGGQAIVRPFSIAEQANTPGEPACFTAVGEVTIIKKHFERTSSFEMERQRRAEQARALNAEMKARHHAAMSRADRAWYREPER